MKRFACLALLWLAGTAGAAEQLPCSDGVPIRYTFRLRAPESGGALAYLLYAGFQPGVYDPAPVALVMMEPEGGGVLRGFAGVFDPAQEWFVALASFGAGGESVKSNELHIPARARHCAGPTTRELRQLLEVIDGSEALIEGAGQRLRRVLEAMPQ